MKNDKKPSIQQLQKIRRFTLEKRFYATYNKLLIGKTLTAPEQLKVIKQIAGLFVSGDSNLKKFAYFLSIKYAISSGDYAPLKYIASKLGYYPVLKKILTIQSNRDVFREEDEQTFDDMLNRAIMESYKDQYYRSRQQDSLYKVAATCDNVTTVAPTSYGKTEIMVEKSLRMVSNGEKVCIITPSKSLLGQTLGKIINERGKRGVIITHPDMLIDSVAKQPHLALLTQERLMAILAKRKDFSYDYIFVDEAHNIFSDGQRADTLSQVLLISLARNENLKIDYYTPFAFVPEKSFNILGDKNSDNRITNKITENMKIPQFFMIDNEGKVIRYDQFLDKAVGMETKYSDPWGAFFEITDKGKTIVYVNKPSDAEKIANTLFEKAQNIRNDDMSSLIVDAKKAFAEQAGAAYNLNRLIDKGIFISHGKMLDIVRSHSEFLFNKLPNARYLVTTSTLLEGVNIPADRIILLDYKKGKPMLSRADFLNLAGRVGRFNVIFDQNNTSLESLLPQIYVMKTKEIMPSNADIYNFLRSNASAQENDSDNIGNALLKEYQGADKNNRRLEKISDICNIDPERRKKYLDIIGHNSTILARTDFGKSCYSRGIKSFDIIANEQIIDEQLTSLKKNEIQIEDGETLIDCIKTKILAHINEDDEQFKKSWLYKLIKVDGFDYVVKAAINERASGGSYHAKAIFNKIKNWSARIPGQVYVGMMGDCDKDGNKDSRWKEYHTFLDIHDPLLSSYAMGLIKENDDDIDFHLMPLFEVLNDLGLLNERFYNLIKFATDNAFEIRLIKAGADLSLAKKISDNIALKGLFAEEGDGIICKDKGQLIKKMKDFKIPLMYINSVENLF